MARNYSSISEPKTLTANVSSVATQITLNNVTGLPSVPYVLVLNPDTANEEVILVTTDQTGVTAPTLKVTRAIETGATAKTHTNGDAVKHMIVGTDLQIVHDHFSATTGVHGIAGALAPIASPTFTGTVVLPSATSIGNVTSTEIGYVDGVTSAIQTQLDTLTSSKAALSPSTNAQTGTTYTLVLADAGKYVEMNNASANVLTVPTNATVAYPVGTEITVIQTGAGNTTITPTAGVTVNYYSLTGAATRTIKAQWAAATLVKRATDTWVLIGNLG
jgi:hypothetical protein